MLISTINSVIAVVEKLTEVKKDLIISKSRAEEVVEARALLCYFLLKKGLLTSEIAKIIRRSRRQTRYIIINNVPAIEKKVYYTRYYNTIE